MGGFVSTDNAKADARIDHDEEDALVERLISAAARAVEDETGFVAPKRTAEKFRFDRFGRALRLPLRPINLETIAITYLDANGEEQTLTEFRTFERNGFTRIMPAIGTAWPTAACVPASVTVAADVGFADAAETIPAELQQASSVCVTAWYNDREGSAEPPPAFYALLRGERSRRL